MRGPVSIKPKLAGLPCRVLVMLMSFEQFFGR
jgi:hypothetical protein